MSLIPDKIETFFLRVRSNYGQDIECTCRRIVNDLEDKSDVEELSVLGKALLFVDKDAFVESAVLNATPFNSMTEE